MTETPTLAAPPTPSPEAAQEVGRVQWWLDTIAAMASELRAAGVSSVSVGGFSATLLPAEPPAPKFEDIKNEEPMGNPPALLDPHSYPDGTVPGFVITRLDPEE